MTSRILKKGTTEHGSSGGGGKLSEPVGVSILGGSKNMLARENWEMYLKLLFTTKNFKTKYQSIDGNRAISLNKARKYSVTKLHLRLLKINHSKKLDPPLIYDDLNQVKHFFLLTSQTVGS